MAWPKLRNKSSGPLMTVSNRSGAAHDGARSQETAPGGAPGGQARMPFLRAQGARRTERADGPEPVRDAPVTWPGQAPGTAGNAEAAPAEGTAVAGTAAEAAGAEAMGTEPATAEPESADLPLWDWSPSAEGSEPAAGG